MTAKGYYRFTYKGHKVVLEKMENEWWIDVDGVAEFEPKELRRWAKDAAIRHIDATE